MWPDSGKPEWRGYASKWGVFHATYLATPALVGVLGVLLVFLLDGLRRTWVWLRPRRRTSSSLGSGLGAWLGARLDGLGARLDTRAVGLSFVALHLVGLVVVAAMIFGDTRLRTPYDPFILLLAVEAYASALWLSWALLRSLRNRRSDEPTQTASSAKLGE